MTSHDEPLVFRSFRPVTVATILVLVAYLGSAALGWPQAGTARVVEGIQRPTHGPATGAPDTPKPDEHTSAPTPPPPLYTVIPFVLLLGAIAVLPLIHTTQHWWESNLHRFYVAAGLACVTLAYYAILHPHAIVGHFPAHYVSTVDANETVHVATIQTLLENALLNEYVPFMTLLFSLYTICGGIRIEGDMAARPLVNTGFLAVGGLLASFIGTTGAAMLLIRPLLDTNRQRKHVAHTAVVFTFIVCNCGGCLLPIGDPPLFLGYLQGVPFFWTLVLWKEWLFVNASLLAIYWAWDHFYYHPRETLPDMVRDETRVHPLRFSGLKLNGALLGGVVLAVALLDPSKTFPGTDWHPWFYLREAVQLGLVVLSLLLGSVHTRQQNHFNFAAILEVAALFFGIFICMQPALQILNARGADLGLDKPWEFFWATGALSSFLDNAPTYLVFFETANALTHEPGPGILTLLSGHYIREDLLIAISLGAVFMGSMTYIGNGPNFMVKAIAESRGVRMPSFFGYMVYSCILLLPLFVLVSILFL